MRKAKEVAGRKCPICGKTENQVKCGKIVRGVKGAFAMIAKNTTPLTPKHESIPRKSGNRQSKPIMLEQVDEGLGKYLGLAKQTYITRLKKRLKISKIITKLWNLMNCTGLSGRRGQTKHAKTPM